MLKNGLQFLPGKESGLVSLFLRFMLLLLKVDFILEKQSCKKDVFRIRSPRYFEIVLTLLAEVITFPMQVFIVEVRIPGFEWSISRCAVNLKLTIFLALNK